MPESSSRPRVARRAGDLLDSTHPRGPRPHGPTHPPRSLLHWHPAPAPFVSSRPPATATRTVKDELRANLIARLKRARTAVPGHHRLRAHGRAADRQRHPVAPRLHPARAARAGQDAPAARRWSSSWTSGSRRSRAARCTAIRSSRSRTTRGMLIETRGDDDAARVDRARGALPGEARDAGRDHRRPDRRHRPDQGGDA
mgnify:CR=1 FL=1